MSKWVLLVRHDVLGNADAKPDANLQLPVGLDPVGQHMPPGRQSTRHTPVQLPGGMVFVSFDLQRDCHQPGSTELRLFGRMEPVGDQLHPDHILGCCIVLCLRQRVDACRIDLHPNVIGSGDAYIFVPEWLDSAGQQLRADHNDSGNAKL